MSRQQAEGEGEGGGCHTSRQCGHGRGGQVRSVGGRGVRVEGQVSRQGLQVTRAGGFVPAGGGLGQEARGGQVGGKGGGGWGGGSKLVWQELSLVVVCCRVATDRSNLCTQYSNCSASSFC